MIIIIPETGPPRPGHGGPLCCFKLAPPHPGHGPHLLLQTCPPSSRQWTPIFSSGASNLPPSSGPWVGHLLPQTCPAPPPSLPSRPWRSHELFFSPTHWSNLERPPGTSFITAPDCSEHCTCGARGALDFGTLAEKESKNQSESQSKSQSRSKE